MSAAGNSRAPSSSMPIASILSDKENAPAPKSAASAPAPAPAKAASRKRKSTEEQDLAAAGIDLDDIDVDHMPITENCDQIRRKINRFIDSGAMSKTAFSREIGVSAKSLSGFLGEHGPDKGSGYAAYDAAWAYFKKREMAGLKMPTKKPKLNTATTTTTARNATAATAAAGAPAPKGRTAPVNSAGVDISDVYLEGEETDDVPVYDTCDEVRRKINAHLKKPGVTQAQFCRDIMAQLHPEGKPANIQSSQLARFRGMKGPNAGATSCFTVQYYVFFEKLRIKEKKPKSKTRLEMEEVWGFEGFNRNIDGRTSFICMAGERPYVNRYGQISFS
ncbi:hypothetical protein B0T19DRAFT_436625 [Cercophora scortea]|uniref:DUF7726 domain-containing protein n=1 Tax=Cercophora scortea TaxID=314031 RepID=A0AAE0J2Q8_9PEZI|nr:hypothetical protein B0T19DRAFT_436625 [Cercophora scortea]